MPVTPFVGPLARCARPDKRVVRATRYALHVNMWFLSLWPELKLAGRMSLAGGSMNNGFCGLPVRESPAFGVRLVPATFDAHPLPPAPAALFSLQRFAEAALAYFGRAESLPAGAAMSQVHPFYWGLFLNV